MEENLPSVSPGPFARIAETCLDPGNDVGGMPTEVAVAPNRRIPESANLVQQ
jgi:hypothetical protein